MPSTDRPRDPIAELHDVSVRFGDTRAVDHTSLAIRAGEIHALLGENGAGKSTVLKVLAGLIAPHTGEVRTRPGVRLAYVPQELELPWSLNVAEWLFLGQELFRPWPLVDRRRERALAAAWLEQFGLPIAPEAPLSSLSAPLLQWVQIVRAARTEPDLLLLDEPTATLSLADTERLFRHLRTLAQRGTAIVFVTHRLAEVHALADWVTVMRDGTIAASGPEAAFTADRLVALMAGSGGTPTAPPPVAASHSCLEVRELCSGIVRDVSFTVRAGEIVGLAGLSGSGRSTLLEALAGLRPFTARKLARVEPTLLVPEDRLRKGLLFQLSLRENVFLPAPSAWLHPRRERQVLRTWLETLRIRAAGPEVSVLSLSGGNQQKVLLARVLRREPRLLLLDEPTAGVDVATKADIYSSLQRLAGGQCAILWASSDAMELLQHSQRVLALCRGRLVADRLAASLTEAELVALITGASDMRPGGAP